MPVSDRSTDPEADDASSHIILGMQVAHLDDCFAQVIESLRTELGGTPSAAWWTAIERILLRHGDLGPEDHHHATAIVHAKCIERGPRIQVLVRLDNELAITDDDGLGVRFVWILIGETTTHPHLSVAVEFQHLMADASFRERALAAPDAEALAAVYTKELDDELQFAAHIPRELKPRPPLQGILADVRRRLPHYVSDFKDGLTTRSVASALFLFFACLAPTVAFGGLLGVLTEGAIGPVETIIATAICGVTYALFSGQPLTIIGSTGPIVIFLGMVYSVTSQLGLPFLPALSWVGLWTALFCVLLTVFDANSWLRFFTRFTDDTFAALISIIYIMEALKDIGSAFNDVGVSHDTALLSLVLALGTYQLATSLSAFRRSSYLRRTVREFLADFGPSIAIAVMTGVAFYLHEVELPTLAVPDTVTPSGGRSWLVNPFDAPSWWWGAAALPAVLATILVYLDQNITVRLVNSPGNRLKKGGGYNQDMLVVAILIAVCSLIGLPWCVAATVRSLNHVRSLAVVENVPQEGLTAAHERTTGAIETRVTGLSIHLLIGGSLLLLPLLKQVPMSVLFGLFLFMGVASTRGNQLFERVQFWAMDPAMVPTTSYLRAVPRKWVSRYTAIQAVGLATLWVVKASALGILFPLFIGLLVPVRMLLRRWFKPEYLALLDGHEEPEDTQEKGVG